MKPILVDAHEDLAYNILNFRRDYTLSAAEIRRREIELQSPAPRHNGQTLLGWEDYQRARVAIIFSTLFVTPIRRRTGDWDKQAYSTSNEAHRFYRDQLDAYTELTEKHPDHFRLIHSRTDLKTLLTHWNDSRLEKHPVGLVTLMEGAEGVRSLDELEDWWRWGVRILGPAWAGNRFCGGTREPGPLTEEGVALLRSMAGLGFTLDLSHMDELAARQALDLYPGPIIASHANAASLLPGYSGNRHLSDTVIAGLIDRNGVIGVVPFCRFLAADWKTGDPRSGITLETLSAHVDHICQIAGDARHVGIGSDFDGGFGLSAAPADVDTIADLQKLAPILQAKGYNDEQIAAVLGGNWLRFLETSLP